jgi:hypothetical protein
MEKTITFDESVKGWTSFHSFLPDGIVSIGSNLFTLKDGQLYIHNSEEVNRNTYYGVSYPSKVALILNDEPSEVKVLQAISFKGSDPWETLIKAYINDTNTSIDSSIDSIDFLEREGVWHAYVRRGENVVGYDSRATYGIGRIEDLTGSTISIPIKPTGMSEGDTILKYDGNSTTSIGTITNISGNTLTLSSVVGLVVGDFILGFKSPKIEGSAVRGYSIRLDLQSNVYDREVELFSVDYEIVKSFM